MPLVKINDINIYYEVHGEGEPLVLIEGLGTALPAFRPLIDIFSKNFKVIAFDNRGVGRTDMPDIEYTIEMMVADTVGLLDHLGIESAHILGTSMGGRIAMALRLTHPERVKSLVLVSTYAASSVQLGTVAPVKWSGQNKANQPYYAFMRQREASRAYNCVDRLHELDLPVLILHGKTDKVYPLDKIEYMHQSIKGSRLVWFEGGHGFFLDPREIELFTRTAADFLLGLSD